MPGKALTEAQQAARIAILRDVDRSGGLTRWSELFSSGRRYKQVMACVRRGDFIEPTSCHFEITAAGRAALALPTRDAPDAPSEGGGA